MPTRPQNAQQSDTVTHANHNTARPGDSGSMPIIVAERLLRCFCPCKAQLKRMLDICSARHVGGGGLADACSGAGCGVCMKCWHGFGFVPAAKFALLPLRLIQCDNYHGRSEHQPKGARRWIVGLGWQYGCTHRLWDYWPHRCWQLSSSKACGSPHCLQACSKRLNGYR